MAKLKADPPWLPGCMANIQQLGGTLCAEQHCVDAQSANHKICTCVAPYLNGCLNNPTPNCCSYTATSPVWVALPGGGCYCCCGCFAHDTPVAVSATENKPIAEIMVGDVIYVAEDATLKNWTTKTVQFSSGTGDKATGTIMIQIDFGTDEKTYETLYVTPGQVFYMPGGKLKRANTLVPGVDELVHADGTTVPILQLTTGYFEKGIHHVATSQTVATSMDGHLMLAKGIVCGDFALQLLVSDDVYVPGYRDLPEIGTKEYMEAYQNIPGITQYKASLLGSDPRQGRSDGIKREGEKVFSPFGAKDNARIPDDVNYFVRKEQAADIQANAPRWPITSGAGVDMYNYLVKLFKGFFPGVTFYLDVENEVPNAYSFIEYNTPFIVVNGGLIRTKCMGFELLALVIAHELEHLYGGDPKGENGYTCEGMADYAAIAAVFPYIWFGMYSYTYRAAALDQVQVFFNFINEENKGGMPGNRCNFISIDCRLSAMAAASSTKDLPYCAGGNADPNLQVTGASAVQNGQYADVTITFNVAVDAATASALGNYVFRPKTAAYKAAVSPTDPAAVIVTADILPGTDYLVSVYNVLSDNDEPLVPGKNQATFTLDEGGKPVGTSTAFSNRGKK